MGVFGDVQQLCPCYKKYQDFHKLIENEDFVVYSYEMPSENVRQAEAIESAASTNRYVFILQNKKNVKITTSEIISESEIKNISCPRCKKTFKHAQKLMQGIQSIERNTVISICDHCRKNAQTNKNPFCACEELVKKFVSVEGKQEGDTEKRVKVWLSKIGHFEDTGKTLKKSKQIKIDAYSNLKISGDVESDTPRIKPEVEQMFYSDKHIQLDDSEMSETDLKEVKQAVRFTQPTETLETSLSHTSHEEEKNKKVIPGTSAAVLGATIVETHVEDRNLPRPSLKDHKQEKIFQHDIPSKDAKEVLKIRHDLSLRHTMRYEKEADDPFSLTEKANVYDISKNAQWEQKTPTSEYNVHPEIDIHKKPISTRSKHELGPSGTPGLHFVSPRLVTSPKTSEIDLQDQFSTVEKYQHYKIKNELKDSNDTFTTPDKFDHKSKRLYQHVAKPKSGLSQAVGDKVVPQYSFFYPKDKKMEEQSAKLNVSSSQLIKDTQEKYRLQAEKEKKKTEEKRLRKLEEEQKKKLAREEKRLAQEEKKLDGEEEKRQDEEKRRQAIEEQKRLAQEEEKRQEEEKKRQAIEEQKRLAREEEKRQEDEKRRQAIEEQKRLAREEEIRQEEAKRRQAIEEQKRLAREEEKRQEDEKRRQAIEKQKRLARDEEKRQEDEKRRQAIEEQERLAPDEEKQQEDEKRMQAVEEQKKFGREDEKQREEEKKLSDQNLEPSESQRKKETKSDKDLDEIKKDKKSKTEKGVDDKSKLAEKDVNKVKFKDQNSKGEITKAEKWQPKTKNDLISKEEHETKGKDDVLLTQKQQKDEENKERLRQDQLQKAKEHKDEKERLKQKQLQKEKKDNDKKGGLKQEPLQKEKKNKNEKGGLKQEQLQKAKDGKDEKGGLKQEQLQKAKEGKDEKGGLKQDPLQKEKKDKDEKEGLEKEQLQKAKENKDEKGGLKQEPLQKEKEDKDEKGGLKQEQLQKAKEGKDDTGGLKQEPLQKERKHKDEKEGLEQEQLQKAKDDKGGLKQEPLQKAKEDKDEKGGLKQEQLQKAKKDKDEKGGLKQEPLQKEKKDKDEKEGLEQEQLQKAKDDKGGLKQEQLQKAKEDKDEKRRLKQEQLQEAKKDKNEKRGLKQEPLRKEKEDKNEKERLKQEQLKEKKEKQLKEIDAASKKGQAKQDEIKDSLQEIVSVKKGEKEKESKRETSKKESADLLLEIQKLQKERLKEKEQALRQKQEAAAAKAKEEAVRKIKAMEVQMKNIKIDTRTKDIETLEMVRIKQAALMRPCDIKPELVKEHKCHHAKGIKDFCPLCLNSELELEVLSLDNNNGFKKNKETDVIIGEKIFKYKPRPKKVEERAGVPLLFKKKKIKNVDKPPTEIEKMIPKEAISVAPSSHKGITLYALSDRTYIDNGWTVLPTETVMRKMNIYRMRPAHPELDWFEHNKKKGLMTYDTGEKLAEFDDNGRARLYYRNGRLALDYYDAKETNAQQRIVTYSSGEPDERGRTHPITILATFDYLGNGIVFDHTGKIRLKYNQTEGVVLDRGIGPVSHWKWHSLNDPPVLQQVMIDTQLTQKDPNILKLGSATEVTSRPDNEEMLAIEFENFIKEKSKKLSQKFKPFQIKMKALKINEHFSLKVLDQATVYLIFRDGSTNVKLNIGMILDHQEIVDTETAELGDVANSLERYPARTDSLADLQRSVAHAQHYERQRERRLRLPKPCGSADQLTAAVSRPMRPPFRTLPPMGTSSSSSAGYSSRKPGNNLYYDTRLL